MANRAYLRNTNFLTSDRALLEQRLAEPGNDYLTVDGPGYRLPIPWLCCFRPEDLKPVAIDGEDWEGNPLRFTVSLPSTSVSQAIRNLEAALPLFEQITGETQMARRYWSDALAWLRHLPLPWLALDATEILTMGELEDAQEDLARALAGTFDAIPWLKGFACYEDGALPYPVDVLMNVPGPYNDQRRTDNAIALDIGAGAEMWFRSEGSPLAEETDYAAPVEPGRRDLGTVLGHARVLLRARDPDAYAVYGFTQPEPDRPERLKLLLKMSTDARRDALLHEPRVRSLLDGPIADELGAICTGHGFEWSGFVIESEQTLARRLADRNQWVTLAPQPPLR
jgi:hypothetical protein